MEEKKTRLNDAIIAKNIEIRMDKISAGDLPFAAAAELLNEIKGLIAKLEPSVAVSYTPYIDMMQERVARHYLINGLNNEDAIKDDATM